MSDLELAGHGRLTKVFPQGFDSVSRAFLVQGRPGEGSPGQVAARKELCRYLSEHLEWIAPIKVYPGEDELQSLSDGVFRVLCGEEQPKKLQLESLASNALTMNARGNKVRALGSALEP